MLDESWIGASAAALPVRPDHHLPVEHQLPCICAAAAATPAPLSQLCQRPAPCAAAVLQP